MPYGTVKVDNVTFTNNSVDATTTFSGIYASITNNLTLSGTATAATFTGTTANFTNVNAQNISVTTSLSGLAITGGTAGFTTITGTTVTGTTANFATLSGTTVTGTTARFITITGGTAGFTTITGTTVTGTTANFVTVSGTTVTGTTARFITITGGTAAFTTITGTTVTGTTANFVTVSGTTVTGTTASFTSGIFTSLSGTTHTITSGVFALGTAALPSISFVSDPNTGIYSPGADQVAVATNGTGRLFVDASGNVGVGISNPGAGASGGARILNIAAGSPGAISTLTFGDTNAIGVIESVNGNGVLKITTGDSIQFVTSSSSERARIRSDGTFEIKGAGTAGVSPGFSVNPSTPANSFVIDSSGRLGIGNSSPQSVLDIGGVYQAVRTHLSSLTDTFHQYRGTPDGTGFEHARVFSGRDTSVHTYGAYLAFYTEGKASGTTDTSVERLRIDSSGRVGIGTSAPSYEFQVNAASDAVMSTSNSSSVTSGNRGTIAHLNSANSTCGMFRFAAVTDNVGTEIQFHTRPAAGSLTQTMTLDSAGRLGIGTTSPRNGNSIARLNCYDRTDLIYR
jgi:hypothetical protein